MQIAILYICTGKYSIFWKDFYLSAERNFLPALSKHYFVFTDSKIDFTDKENVTVLYQQKLGWPFDTLNRFHFFLRIEDQLKAFDYIFFLNANAFIKNTVDENILPVQEEFIGSLHPCFYNKPKDQLIYDRNPESLACVARDEEKYYFMGAFIGGKALPFLTMCNELKKRIDIDFKKGVIALWHDESHLNKYLLDKEVKTLSPSYVYPEEMQIPYEPIILLRDKKQWGGHNHLREKKVSEKRPAFSLRLKHRLAILQLRAGLGNQLFQYAVLKQVCNTYGCFLAIDISSYSTDGSKRKPSILNLKIKGKIFSDGILHKMITPGNRIYGMVKRSKLSEQINEPNFFYNPQVLKPESLISTFKGYWQTERYFEDIRATLIEELRPVNDDFLKNISWLNSNDGSTIGVHVRRADYLSDTRYGFVGLEYYKKAFSVIAGKVRNPYFVIFSDDMEWCKINFREFNYKISFFDKEDCTEDYKQLIIMSRCSHQIIANSSFSWWGAWLNTDNDKIVIRPSKPFSDESLYYENYYPASWISI